MNYQISLLRPVLFTAIADIIDLKFFVLRFFVSSLMAWVKVVFVIHVLLAVIIEV